MEAMAGRWGRGVGALLVTALAALPARSAAAGDTSLILATTTSTRDSGLLDELVPRFEAASAIRVKVIAVGTGAALRMAERGDADAVLVHAPAAERPLVEAGHLVEGRFVMYNDFVLLGPPDDPAGARVAGSLAAALAAIARHGGFASRGDDSGTHKRELALWALAGVDPMAIERREETGQGMGATLRVASERRAYTLADRGTYLAQERRLELVVVHEGGAELANPYHAYVVNPARHEGVAAPAARAFVAYLIAPTTQDEIGRFRREVYGRSLFHPAPVAVP